MYMEAICIDLWIYTIMSHNEAVSWLQWCVDLILPGLSVGLMSQYSGLLPPSKWARHCTEGIDIQSKMEAQVYLLWF